MCNWIWLDKFTSYVTKLLKPKLSRVIGSLYYWKQREKDEVSISLESAKVVAIRKLSFLSKILKIIQDIPRVTCSKCILLLFSSHEYIVLMLDLGYSLYSWQPIYSAFHSFIPSFNCVFKYIQTQARAPNVLHPILLSPRGIMGCYAGGISRAVNLNRFLQPFWLENCKVRETFTDKWLIQYRDLVFRLCNVTKCTCWSMAKFNVKDNITALKQQFFFIDSTNLALLKTNKGVFCS